VSASDRPLAIVDIDGVVADVRHRLHHLDRRPKNWKAFFAEAEHDDPHVEGLELVRLLAADHEVIFLTGRPENLKKATRRWLTRQGIGEHRLVMRPPDDRRPAAQVKVEMLAELAKGRRVELVVDDDPVVIESMRRAGYTTLHAAWEQRAIDEERTLREAQEGEGRT
jgi:uncharacterized HAD superfamily protein